MSNAIMFSLRFLIIFFLFTLFFPSANGQLPECSQPYNCGLLKNISYPFWGGNNRSQRCGRHGFELLNCEEDQNPLMKIQGQDFLVLNISQGIQAMTIARSDLWDSPCTKDFTNTTLDYDRFAYNAQTVRNMTIFYGCVCQTVRNNFTCKIDGTNKDVAYFVVDSLPRLPRPVPNSTSCLSSIRVPIYRMSLDHSPDNGTTHVQQVLKRGFEVEYKADLELCSSCKASHGTCGSNLTSNDFLCFCGSPSDIESYPHKCPGNTKALHVAIGFAFIAVSAILLWVLLCCIKNRIKNLIRNFVRKKNDRGLEAFIRENGPLLVERYKFSEIRKMTKSFKDKLGQGGFGDVYKGYLRNGSPVAVKVLNASKGNGEDFINEVASISRTSHVNVVTLLGYCFEGQKKALIYEFMPNGSLEKYIYNENALRTSSPQLEVEQLLDIATGIARGLEYLHRGCNTRILHFDIKPHNILLDENFCPKISDFGLSKLCPKEESNVSMVDKRGTFGFVAPEVLSRNYGQVSVKSDVYSYGMMVLEMVGRRKNINTRASHTSEVYFPDWIYKRLKGGSNLGLPSVVTEEENDLARKMILVGLWCIQTKPSDRPSMSKVIEMLQGSIEALQIPPRPVLTSSPIRTSPESSTLPDVEQMTESIKDLIEERKTNTRSGNFQIWRPSSYLGS